MDEEIQESSLGEAERTMTICNACRYCEGLCATFQAMTLRRAFAEADLDYLFAEYIIKMSYGQGQILEWKPNPPGAIH